MGHHDYGMEQAQMSQMCTREDLGGSVPYRMATPVGSGTTDLGACDHGAGTDLYAQALRALQGSSSNDALSSDRIIVQRGGASVTRADATAAAASAATAAAVSAAALRNPPSLHLQAAPDLGIPGPGRQATYGLNARGALVAG